MRKYENLSCLHENRLKQRAYYIPENEGAMLSLNGIWDFAFYENDFDDDVTVIKTKYNTNGEEGTIAVVGPKRMEYDRVITLLDYIKHHIEKQ